MNIEQTISDLSRLSVEDRLRIVQELWDSISSDSEVTVSSDQQAELKRRIAAHHANPDSAISKEELEQLLRSSD